MSRPSWIGQTIGGRYRIDDLLGQGGMSAVYKAYDPNLKRVVAVKMIHTHLADDPKFVVRFEEEAAAVAQLRHPNIVQVFDFNHDGDVYFMVQEFVAGETLQERLRRVSKAGRLMPLQEAVGYILNICDATHYAHSRGLIHRDIKPANIMVDVNNQAILMDFGIVKITGGEKHTATGAVVGTALYLAPEAIRGEAADARSDMYSLAVTLFEAISGRPPFEADSAMTLMMMHLNDPLPSLTELRPDAPYQLVAAVEKALAKKREDRFGSMAEFAAALRSALASLGAPSALLTQADPSLAGNFATRLETGAPARLTPAPPLRPTGSGQQPAPHTAPRPASGQQSVVRQSGSLQRSGVSLTPPPPSRKPWNFAILAGVGAAALMVFGVLVVIGVLMARSVWLAGQAQPTQPLAPAATPPLTATEPPGGTTPTHGVSETPQAALAPEATITPTLAPSQTPTITPSPTPTIPAGVPYVRINAIAVNQNGYYVVEYETFEFTEALPGEHIHFFFNTVLPEQAGVPGAGPWILYGGPRPFEKYRTADRPASATQLCALVAERDHSIQPLSGNCLNLPDVNVAQPVFDDPCSAGPGPGFATVAQLAAGQPLLVTGLSADEAWWIVEAPGQNGNVCWLERKRANFAGDISILPVVDLPEGSGSAPKVEITSITVDAQGRYVVTFTTQGFEPALPGTHIHFYFDVFAADQLGGAGGNRLMFGGDSPFTGYTQADRPSGAAQLCALVAADDHTSIANSGNCFDLP